MVRNILVTGFTLSWAFWFAIVSVTAAVLPSAALAQQLGFPDFESPIIEHEERRGGPVGGVEVFGATVVDNDELARVSLRYRFTGETEYAELVMREIASSSFYTGRVDTTNVPASNVAIEYYIQAEDISGNLVLKGFAFQPLTRAFQIPQTVATPAVVKSVVPAPAASQGINWLYFGLGVLVIGGIAAASRGGQSNSDDCVGGCDVVLTFPTP